ncbi:MAG: DNA replication/repair protein RecF [Verrucomicrobiae bacterium]|nr:DNA replication/repair protein RecF [Verrucomicrobiae bacterium]
MLVRLHVRDFRNLDEVDLELGPGASLFWGENAQGKTNLLEAVYYLSSARSFRSASGGELVKEGAPSFEIAGDLQPEGDRLRAAFHLDQGGTWEWNGNRLDRAVDFAGRLPAVVFHSGDLRLARGRPADRIRWLDHSIAQREPPFLKSLARFQRALRMRNAALKDARSNAELDALDETFVGLARAITSKRSQYWPALQGAVRNAYAEICARVEEVTADFASGVSENFDEILKASLAADRAAGATQLGSHRDRIELRFGNLDAGAVASEGQARSLALAFKIAQVRFLRSELGRDPLLLLDDVWGELDASRRSALETLVAASPQVLATATDAGRTNLKGWTAAWKVKAGRITPAA